MKPLMCDAVLNGGTAKDCVKVTKATKNETGIRTIYYVPMRCNNDPTLICQEKGLKSGDPLPPDYIEQQIDEVLFLEYDGIFFDQTDKPEVDFDNNLYERFANHVKKKDKKKLVIVNPGVSDKKVCRMFVYANIVSVENHWGKKVPECSGIEKWRWLSVQGDPSNEHGEYAQPPTDEEGSKAIDRLRCFRKNGGFWYFTTPWRNGVATDKLPKFLNQLSMEANQDSKDCLKNGEN